MKNEGREKATDKNTTEKNKSGKNKPNKRLVLLDSHAILHRAYHALPEFSSSKGEPTGALYGLVTMILNIIEKLKPDYVVACYDLPKPTYRHEAYKDYKAGRAKTDEALVAQIIRSRDIFSAFNIPIYELEGFEADDMLGTIVEQVLRDKLNIDVIIASGDMDTLQLVSGEQVQVFTLKKGIKDTIMYDEEAVVSRFGFGPQMIPDYKGLRGDTSDNIIGIKGIGEKTATELITKFGGIEDIYKKLKKDKKAFKEAGFTDRIIGLIESGEEEAEFSKMLATIRRDAPIIFKLPDHEWRGGVDIKKVEELFKVLEFKTLGIRVKEVIGLTDAFGDEISVDKSNAEANIEPIDPVLLKKAEVALWVLDSNQTGPTIDDIYSFTKSDDLKKAYEILEKTANERGQGFVLNNIELPLINVLEKMHDVGIEVDTERLLELSKNYHKKLESLEKEIWKQAGLEFNINSPKQMGEVLFNKLQIKVKGQKKTAGGALSTRESELIKMADSHPIIPLIMQHRELQKLLSTYIDTIPTYVGEDKRLHTTFVQTGSATGRMSSINPNMQNIPIKSELGRSIRDAFVACKGYELVEFDYSQIELRLAAFLSGDKNLIEIFKSGRDVHTEVAARVFKKSFEDVDKEMRRKAKVINFGILYGMGVNALKINLGSDRAEAQQFYNEYFATFTGLADYLNKVKSEAARKGYTETFFGRRRYFEGIKSKIPFIRASAERMAINAPIQGTGADIIKLAMITADQEIEAKGLKNEVRLSLQIHDSLIYEIKKDKVPMAVKMIKKIMENILTTDKTQGVPIIANAAVGKDWGDMKNI